MDYISYLKDEIKRLELIDKYNTKVQNSNKEKTKSYYLEGIKLLLQQGESFENYSNVLKEYREALNVRELKVKQLYDEIKIIKKLKV